MSKFIEVTDHKDEKVLLNLDHVEAVFEASEGSCVVSGRMNNSISPKESYAEIKAIITHENETCGSYAYKHLEKQFYNAVKRVNSLTSENLKYEKALKTLSQADDFCTADFAMGALEDD